jgi:hypothetical protein
MYAVLLSERHTNFGTLPYQSENALKLAFRGGAAAEYLVRFLSPKTFCA